MIYSKNVFKKAISLLLVLFITLGSLPLGVTAETENSEIAKNKVIGENSETEKLEVQSLGAGNIGETITYYFKELEVNYPIVDENWDPSGKGTDNFKYSEISPIGMTAIKSASNGMVTYRTKKKGDYVKYNFNVPQTGKYKLGLQAFKGIGGGIADIKIDGEKISEFDFYQNPGSALMSIPLDVEDLILAKGDHELSFEIIGKSNTAYYYIYLFNFFLTLQEIIPEQLPEINPVTAEFYKTPYELQSDIELEIVLNGNSLISVKNGNEFMEEDKDYFINDQSIIIKKEYLELQEFGEAKIVFNFDNENKIEVSINIINGLVLNAEIFPANTDFDKNVENQENIFVEIIFNGNELQSLNQGINELQLGSHYITVGSGILVKKEYLETLPNGITDIIFNFSEGNNCTLKINVIDSTINNSQISIERATFDKYSHNQDDITIQLILNDNTLKSIKNGEVALLKNTHYTLLDNTVTIKKGYLQNQSIGTSILSFVFDKGNNAELTVIIKDTTPAGINLVPNPGFEDDINNHNAPDLWRFGRAGTGDWEYDKEVKYDGEKSIKLINNAANDRAYLFYQFIPVKPGSKYEYSAYYKTEDMLGQPFIQLTWYSTSSSGGFIQAKPINTELEANDWKKVSVVLDAPNDANFAYVSVQLKANTGSVWFDNVELKEIIQNSTINPISTQFNRLSSEQGDIIVTASYNSNIIVSIKNGEQILNPGEDYIVNNDIITIKKEYLETLDVGTTYLTFVFNQGNNQVLTLIVNDSSRLSTSNETFDKNTDEQNDITVFVELNGNSIESISRDDHNLIKDVDYELLDDNIVVFKKEYLKSLPTKTHMFKFKFNQGKDATMTITVADSTTPLQINLVLNPSFEDGDIAPDYWSFNTNSTSGIIDLDSEIRKDGNRSILVSSLNESDIVSVSQKYLKVKSNRSYLVDAFYKAENLNGTVQMTIDWYSNNDSSGHLDRCIVNGLNNVDDWKKIFTEVVAPNDAKYVTISLGIEGGSGKVWFDSVNMRENNILKNPDFCNGLEVPDTWLFNNFGSQGEIELIKDSSNTQYAKVGLKTNDVRDISTLNQAGIPVISEKMYTFKTSYKSEGELGQTGVSISWHNANDSLLRKDDFKCTELIGWNIIDTYVFAPMNAVTATVELRNEKGISTVWFKDTEMKQALINSFGHIIPVTDIEDVTEQLNPAEFWFKLPSVNLTVPAGSIWTQDVFRNFFFGPTENGRSTYFSLDTPSIVAKRDENIPILNDTLGTVIKPGIPLAIAGDIKYNPFVKGHGTYSNKYYPRRMHDYIATDYNTSYVLTGDEKYSERAKELMSFLEFSQWKDNGENEFTSIYFPSEYSKHPEWSGGWDYLFDWRWTDGYRYKWDLHEPDHHVNSQIASTVINSYEIYKDETYLNMARNFLYNQIPRYGFHKGTWNNHTYYWTEYNPTGTTLGNRSDDSTDNVTALVAEACAKVGYYEPDPVLRAKYLEMARGMLWYMVREFETDGRWFYDGAENQSNPGRFSISHDSACIIPTFVALTYLYKAGVDISCFEDTFSKVEATYANSWPMYERKTYMKVSKIYDGVPEPDTTLTFSTFAMAMSDGLENIRFQDKISKDFVLPENIDLRISKILSPDNNNSDWRTDANQDIVYTIKTEQLTEGVIIPFSINKGDTLKISYDLLTTPDFSRESSVDNDSSLSAWVIDKDDVAVFARITSGTSGILKNSHTLPLSTQTILNSENFLSFGARMAFPFEDEYAVLIENSAPTPTEYKHKENWGNVNAKKYIYPVESLIPHVNSSGFGLPSDVYSNKGRVYNANKANDFIEFEFEVFKPQSEYNIISNFAKASNRGIVSMYIDDVKYGESYDLYKVKDPSNQLDIPAGIAVECGSGELEQGKHVLKFVVDGKNAAATGYAIGLYNAIILEPINYTQPSNDSSLAEIKVDGRKLKSFSKDTTEYSVKLPHDYISVPIVTASANGKDAVVKIIPAIQIPGFTQITVTAEDGTIRIYTINFSLDTKPEPDDDKEEDIHDGGDTGHNSNIGDQKNDAEVEEPQNDIPFNTIEKDGTVNTEAGVNGTVKGVFSLDALNEAKAEGNDEIIIVNPIANMSIDLMLLKDSLREGAGNIEITIEEISKEKLSPEIIEDIDGKSVYKFNISEDGETITKLNGKNAIRVSIPYKLAAGEDPNKIVIYRITDEGNLEVVKNCVYDIETGSITCKTDNLGMYVAKQASVLFKDVNENSWSKGYIDTLAARQIILGKTPEKFDPLGSVTRAEFITLIMRSFDFPEGQQEGDVDNEDDFDDIKKGEWYYDAISTAKKLGIVSGIGNNEFGRDINITRQEMAVMLYNAIKVGNVKIGSANNTLKFGDSNDIADYAQEAVYEMQKAGIFEGAGNNMFLPKQNATREEAAKVIYLLIQMSLN